MAYEQVRRRSGRRGHGPGWLRHPGSSRSDSDRTWDCETLAQVENTAAMSEMLAEAGVGQPIKGKGVCLPTDHAGIVADLLITPAAQDAAAPIPPSHEPWINTALVAIIGILWGFLALLALLVAGVILLVRRVRRCKPD